MPPLVPPPALSEAEADRRNSGNLFDVEALSAKADHRFAAADYRAANSFYAAALRALQKAAQADSGALAPAQRAEVERISAIRVWLAQRFREHLLGHLERAGFGPGARHLRFQKSLEIFLEQRPRDLVSERYPQMPLTYFYPDLPYVDFAPREAFAWARTLEDGFGAMRAEAAALLQQGADFRPYVRATAERPQGDVHGLLENEDWSTLFLWENGAPVAANVMRCPAAFAAVTARAPLCHIGPRAPTIMLSLLKAGARIPPHTGMVNVRFICHLPLIVPPGCKFRVGDAIVEWEEGKLLAFDDTVEHEAWNRSDRDRLVLIFDVWRPELSEAERRQVTAFFDAFDSYGR